MKTKKKLCDHCNTDQYIWKNFEGKKVCRGCWAKVGVAKKSNREPKLRQPIPFRSKKKAGQDALYAVARLKFLQQFPMCHAKIDVQCMLRSNEIHHKSGKIGDLYLDIRYWLPCCRYCHNYLEMNPLEAKELGLSLDRLTKTEANEGMGEKT